VNRARTADLVAKPAYGHESGKLKHLENLNPQPQFRKVNARHRVTTEKRNP